jgi:hypothetical protein
MSGSDGHAGIMEKDQRRNANTALKPFDARLLKPVI